MVKSYEVLIEHYEAEDIAIKKDYVLWNFVKSSAFTLKLEAVRDVRYINMASRFNRIQDCFFLLNYEVILFYRYGLG